MSESLVDRVRESIEASSLIPSGSRVLVGYSGGADSACLLHVLHRLGLDVVAGHLHHGQRPEADAEASKCEGFCASLDIPFALGRADVPRMAKDLKIGMEEAGRNARYQFLERAAFRLQCDRIATAHTRDDHAETVLLNLVRGCGLHGLAGIPVQRGRIVRPMLSISREETRAYCLAEGLWFHDDPANADPAFHRSRLRTEVVPVLRSLNPEFDKAASRLAEIAQDEDRFLNSAAAAALGPCETNPNGSLRFLTKDCEVLLDRRKLEALPAVLVSRAIRLVVAALGAQLDYDQTKLFAQGLADGTSGSLTATGGGVAVEWSKSRIHVRELSDPAPFRHPLEVPGETCSDELGWRLEVQKTSADGYERSRRSLEVVVDASSIKTPLHFRSRAAGDSLQPLGMTGTRKVADLLGEAGLTQAARSRLPIVCDMVGPVWVPGVALADRVRIREDSSAALLLRFGELQSAPRHNSD